jgi:probable F420-dependent oxidoreductase
MKLDTVLLAALPGVSDQARLLAEAGVDGLYTFEGPSEPFFPLVLAAEATALDVYTNVALAFPRSPMTTAYEAWGLQQLSGGRFLLGLGTQVQANIERRYSSVWRQPVARMHEFVEAVRAVFRCWQDGERLDFRGDHYELTLMQPTFRPPPLECGPPPVLVGALGPKMTRMSAEVADGILIHPFNTPRFLDERMVPEIEAGLEAAGRERDRFTVVCDAIVATGHDDKALAEAVESVRGLLAFYASTPAYRVPLAPYGWEGVQPELNRLSKTGRWDEMAGLIDDELLHTVAIVGQPSEIGSAIRARFGGLADRVGISLPYAAPTSLIAEVVDGFRH